PLLHPRHSPPARHRSRLPYCAVTELLRERDPSLSLATRERPPHPSRNRRARELGGLALRVELECRFALTQRLLFPSMLRKVTRVQQMIVRRGCAHLRQPAHDSANARVV